MRNLSTMLMPAWTARALTGSRAFRSVLGLGLLAVLSATGFFAGRLGATVFPQTLQVAAIAPASPMATAGATTSAVAGPADARGTTGAVGGPEMAWQEPYDVLPSGAALPDVHGLSGYAGVRTASVRHGDAGHDGAPGRPTMRPVLGGWMTSGYGHREDPFTGEQSRHFGIDYAGLENSGILAAGAGVVVWSGPRTGYGNLIEIDHGNGWVTRYGHNASNLVAEGDYVRPGQTIALMGSTGRATGTHLHFEVLYEGLHQNPARIVPSST